MPVVQFALPDVGEGLTEAEILSWLVSEGDAVRINDLLVEVETAKAVVELPSPAAGTVTAIHVPAGATVPVGTIIVTIGDPAENPTSPVAPPTGSGARTDTGPENPSPMPEDGDHAPLVLVGTGPSAAAGRTRRLSPPVTVPFAEGISRERPRAKPPVRALAKSLSVELASLPVDESGIVHRDDVLSFAHMRQTDADDSAWSSDAPADSDVRIPVRGIRKITAEAMVRSAFTAPHVTVWLTVDVTETMALLNRLKQDRRFQGLRVNPLLLVSRAFLLAIRRNPAINASWDDLAQEIVRYRRVNLGIAAATPRGLLVPNIKSADTLGFEELAHSLGALIDHARAGTTKPSDMSGGTITITNIGALGLDAGTPILNPGEAAILAFGAIRVMPWVVDGAVVPRHVTQLALSFDHRLVDGELGASVLSDLGLILSDPVRAIAF